MNTFCKEKYIIKQCYRNEIPRGRSGIQLWNLFKTLQARALWSLKFSSCRSVIANKRLKYETVCIFLCLKQSNYIEDCCRDQGMHFNNFCPKRGRVSSPLLLTFPPRFLKPPLISTMYQCCKLSYTNSVRIARYYRARRVAPSPPPSPPKTTNLKIRSHRNRTYVHV